MRLAIVVFLFFYTVSFVITTVHLRQKTIVSPRIEGKVLAYNSEAVFTPIPTPTFIPTPSPTQTPLPINTPTPTPQPQFSQEQIHGFIERFAGQYGVDPNVLRHLAVCESGFNPIAINGPYAGLYQFGKTAWINSRILMGENTDPSLRLNAEEAVQTASFLISRGRSNLWPNCVP